MSTYWDSIPRSGVYSPLMSAPDSAVAECVVGIVTNLVVSLKARLSRRHSVWMTSKGDNLFREVQRFASAAERPQFFVSLKAFCPNLTRSTFINGSFSNPFTTCSSIAAAISPTPIAGSDAMNQSNHDFSQSRALPGWRMSPGFATVTSTCPGCAAAKASTWFSVSPCREVSACSTV